MQRTPLALGLLVSGVAFAFPFDSSWHMPAAGDTPNPTVYDPQGIPGNNRAGAGGIYGTGGAQDFGIKCSHCHIEGTDPYGLIDADISPTPAWQNVGGDDAYSPGQTYTITVTLQNEHRFGGAYPDLNGMAAAIEDANGQRAGTYVTDSGERSDQCDPNTPSVDGNNATTFVYGDCHAALSIATNGNQRQVWSFDWIAPATGAGDLTLFWGVVDGDSGGDNSQHDDVVEGTVPLREGT